MPMSTGCELDTCLCIGVCTYVSVAWLCMAVDAMCELQRIETMSMSKNNQVIMLTLPPSRQGLSPSMR